MPVQTGFLDHQVMTSSVKYAFYVMISMIMFIITPEKTWKPWKPVIPKNIRQMQWVPVFTCICFCQSNIPINLSFDRAFSIVSHPLASDYVRVRWLTNVSI